MFLLFFLQNTLHVNQGVPLESTLVEIQPGYTFQAISLIPSLFPMIFFNLDSKFHSSPLTSSTVP